MRLRTLAAVLGVWAATALPGQAQQQPATRRTVEANREFATGLPWEDRTEAELAARGFVATLKDPKIKDASGRVVMDLSAYDFAKGDAPDTANPSLWRHIGLLRLHGLFQVAPKIWQVRGFDISTMTIIEGDSGFIIVDPLTTKEVAAAAFSLVKDHVGDKPVRVVIYTHSHADHFGGVKGVVSEADVKSGKVAIIAPAGFMEHAVSENLIAGQAMSRRAAYQFGTTLPRGPAGQAGSGIGTVVAQGTLTLIPPTRSIERTGETAILDGVKFEFQVTPATEAPAEMNFFLPDMGALCLAENANVSMHNILPARGALVRDSKAWSDYLTESLRLFGDRTDVMFISHGWPRWGRKEIATYVGLHRDAYKYLHDQSVRMMNQGLTAAEIAEAIRLPDVLSKQWYNRGYYGTMQHNAKAVYQRYLGWYDANPANLNAWPPEEAGKRYVEALGGALKARALAKRAFDKGDYRWSAELASRIVFADRTDKAARELLARSFEQMGYQAESMLWRNMYLTGAAEARKIPATSFATTTSLDLIGATDSSQLFDMVAIRVDPAKAAGKSASIAFVFPDRKERTRVTLKNSVLIHEVDADGQVDATVTLPRAAFLGMVFTGAAPANLIKSGAMKIEGSQAALETLLASLDAVGEAPPFAIVTP